MKSQRKKGQQSIRILFYHSGSTYWNNKKPILMEVKMRNWGRKKSFRSNKESIGTIYWSMVALEEPHKCNIYKLPSNSDLYLYKCIVTLYFLDNLNEIHQSSSFINHSNFLYDLFIPSPMVIFSKSLARTL